MDCIFLKSVEHFECLGVLLPILLHSLKLIRVFQSTPLELNWASYSKRQL